MMLTAPWRLSLLFLVSGVATAYLLSRGGKNFLGSRSIRLLIPLAFGMVVIVPPQSYLEVVRETELRRQLRRFLALVYHRLSRVCRGSDCLLMPTWNHLWFVAYLWVYTVVLYLLVRFLPRLRPALRDFRRTTACGPRSSVPAHRLPRPYARGLGWTLSANPRLGG